MSVRTQGKISGNFMISGKNIGVGEATYLIAEIGSNHDQDREQAFRMIEEAAAAGADAVKFQAISFEKLYSGRHETADLREWFRQIELNESWYQELADKARQNGIDFLCSPTYSRAVDLLEMCDVPAYKIASPQVQADPYVLRSAARTGKPLILSVGYCRPTEIMNAMELCLSEGNENLIFLACTSKYPASPSDSNLRFIETLRRITGRPVGLSDHSLGGHIGIASVAMGACVIEKHVTIDRGRKGPDHHFSMLIEEFAEMVKHVRDVESALGTGAFRSLPSEVVALRNDVELKAFSGCSIDAGEAIRDECVHWRRFTGDAVRASEEQLLARLVTGRRIEAGEPLTWDILQLAEKRPEK